MTRAQKDQRSPASRGPSTSLHSARDDRASCDSVRFLRPGSPAEPANERDGVLNGIRDEKARKSLQVEFAPVKESKIGELAARFEVVLGYTPEG